MPEHWEDHWEDYYAILQVHPSAEPEIIKVAYAKLAQKYHPDRNKDPSAGERMTKLNIAYLYLADAEKRRRYHEEWVKRNATAGGQQAASATDKPVPVMDPDGISFVDVEPGVLQSGSFVASNAGGPFGQGFVDLSDPSNTWLRIAANVPLSEGADLPCRVEIEAVGEDWGKTYVGGVSLFLDEEVAEVRVELRTKPEPVKARAGGIPRATKTTHAPPPPVTHKDTVPTWAKWFIGIVAFVLVTVLVSNLWPSSMTDSPVPTTDLPSAPAPGHYALTRGVVPPGGGTISPSSGTFDSGAVVTLTAIPSAGYKFDYWSGDAAGSSPSITTIMNSDKSVWANFSIAGKIAFVSERDGNHEIYVMNTDGTNQVNLTRNPAADWYPRWSPDATRIAFASNRDDDAEIYVMDANGENAIALTSSPSSDDCPAWSPDGSKIAFVSDRDGNDEIYIMSADGSNQVNLTGHPGEDKYPIWSPDGSKIAFVSKRGDYPYSTSRLVYIMNSNGTQVTRAQDISIDQTMFLADWSPDGKYLAVSKRAALCNPAISLLEIQSGYTSEVAEKAYHGSFSPDSSQLIFGCYRDENWELCVLDTGTKEIVARLTSNNANDLNPDWSSR